VNRVLGCLTAPQAGALAPEAVLVQPIGSYEQHGPHLPVNTDTLLAEEHARRVVEHWGDAHDLWLLPALPYGLALEHSWSPGTVSLPAGQLAQWLLWVCTGLAGAFPARNMLVINGHGGNRGLLEAMARELAQHTGFNLCITHPASMTSARPQGSLPDIHAGIGETSAMLATAPHLVHLDKLPPASPRTAVNADAIAARIQDRSVTWPWFSDETGIGSSGVIGDPAAATAGLGEQIFTEALRRHGQVLDRLLDRPQEGQQQ
jgi:creatinine amidohydrolase/Fe(II)-dependent formamide hydrolase-like protein